jgi:post-segregation antitoxin (ccd killing protein)
MRGWKAKFVFILMVYFAGFATAIYYLVPAPENPVNEKFQESTGYSSVRTEQFVQSFNVAMHKCLDVAKDITLQVSSLIKQKLDEKRAVRQAERRVEETKETQELDTEYH